MLLRLLPSPTATQPAPPTILFTLPLPNQPYTSRGLPLPANLLAHRQVCVQEDISCHNALLGDKSTWLNGIVDDVTFSLPLQQITVHFTDATLATFPVDSACAEQLKRVVSEVNASFQAPPAPLRPVAALASAASQSPSRRSTSSLLLTLLSPLLAAAPESSSSGTSSSRPAPSIHTARIHRRLARSILVDMYRQHVLPALRAHLSPAYLPWYISSELSKKEAEFKEVKRAIDAVLEAAGVSSAPLRGILRQRTTSSSSCDSSSSESEGPVTPSSSRFSSPCRSRTSIDDCADENTPPLSACFSTLTLTPSSYILTLPAHLRLPITHQTQYLSFLSKLSKVASRTSALKKLSVRYEREEAKRRWLEQVDAQRLVEAATRRAAANGVVAARENLRSGSMPRKRSPLWESSVAEAEAEVEAECLPTLQEIVVALASNMGKTAGAISATQQSKPVMLQWDHLTLPTDAQAFVIQSAA